MSSPLSRRSLVLAALALGHSVKLQAQPAQPSHAGLTELAPGQLPADALWDAALSDMNGRSAPLKPNAGRALLVNFWARWCGPCRVEIPELVALKQRHANVDVVGISIESDAAPVRDFARAYDIDYPVRMAADGLSLMRALGNPKAGLPFTLVLDRQARVVALRLGVLTREHLDLAVRLAQR